MSCWCVCSAPPTHHALSCDCALQMLCPTWATPSTAGSRRANQTPTATHRLADRFAVPTQRLCASATGADARAMASILVAVPTAAPARTAHHHHTHTHTHTHTHRGSAQKQGARGGMRPSSRRQACGREVSVCACVCPPLDRHLCCFTHGLIPPAPAPFLWLSTECTIHCWLHAIAHTTQRNALRSTPAHLARQV